MQRISTGKLGALLALSSLAWLPLDGVVQAEELNCVQFHSEARYRIDYDHLVTVQNNCSRAVDCAVSTDVNPQAQNISLAPGQSETVLTFRGSPARVFVPKVDCRQR